MTIFDIMDNPSFIPQEISEKEFDRIVMDAINRVKYGKGLKSFDISDAEEVADNVVGLTLSVSYNGWAYESTSVFVYK